MKELATTTRHSSGHGLKRRWYVIDASGRVLGAVATKAARLMRGKHKTDFSPHVSCGDYVIIINAAKVQVSGNKALDKTYWFHSGYVGSIKGVSFQELLAKHPEKVLELAVKGMIKGTRLGRSQLKLLKVYAGPEHPHGAHKPEPVTL